MRQLRASARAAQAVSSGLERTNSGGPNQRANRAQFGHMQRFPCHGAAQESNLPSLGLPDLTGFEDRLGHRARAAPGGA